MYETYNSYGYDLYQPFPQLDRWVLDLRNGQAYHGTLLEVLKYMKEKLDFRIDDIEEGLTALADNTHLEYNAIHFGIMKSLLYPYKKEIDHERAS